MLLVAGLYWVEGGQARSAAEGKGTRGTFVVTDTGKDCVKRCNLRGYFTSDGGVTGQEPVEWLGDKPRGVQVGDRLRARDTGAALGVFPESGASAWQSYLGEAAFYLIFAVVAAIWWLRLVVTVFLPGRGRNRKYHVWWSWFTRDPRYYRD